jgi:hypothetical protein
MRTNREVDDAVTIHISETSDADPKTIAIIEYAKEISVSVADFLMRSDRAIGIHKQDPDGAAGVSAVIVVTGTDREVRDSISVQIPQ